MSSSETIAFNQLRMSFTSDFDLNIKRRFPMCKLWNRHGINWIRLIGLAGSRSRHEGMETWKGCEKRVENKSGETENEIGT